MAHYSEKNTVLEFFECDKMVEQKKAIPFPKLNFTDKKQGFIVLIIGILVALALGVLATNYALPSTWVYWLLAISVVVGILNIFHEEGILFLISGLTLTFMLNLLAGLTFFPTWAATLFNSVIYVLAPASILVGLKVLYALATK